MKLPWKKEPKVECPKCHAKVKPKDIEEQRRKHDYYSNPFRLTKFPFERRLDHLVYVGFMRWPGTMCGICGTIRRRYQ